MDASSTAIVLLLATMNVAELWVLIKLVRKIECKVCDTNTPPGL